MASVFIYKLIDPITDQVRYVGKTTNLKRRLSNHITRSKTSKRHVSNWIRSLLSKGYKPKIEVIEECDSNWEDREKFWIKQYKEIYDLTNMLEGGQGGGTMGRKGKPWSDAQREKNKKSRTGMKVNHTEEGDLKRREGVLKYLSKIRKPVYQYNLDGDFIKKWDCSVVAGKHLKTHHANITRACKNTNSMCAEYQWKFNFKEKIEKYEKTLKSEKKVVKIDKDIETVFSSLTEASYITGILRTSISNCLNGRTKTAGKFKWKYL